MINHWKHKITPSSHDIIISVFNHHHPITPKKIKPSSNITIIMLRRFHNQIVANNVSRNVSISMTSSTTAISSLRSSSSAFQGEVAALFTAQGQQSILAKKKERLEEFQKDLLAKQKEANAIAEKKPDVFARGTLAYLTAQCCILCYWTYSRFDWCLVEPITYLLGTAVTWLALGYYLFTGGDYDWDNLRGRIFKNQQVQIYAKHNLNAEKMEELRKEIELLEEEIESASTPVISPTLDKNKK